MHQTSPEGQGMRGLLESTLAVCKITDTHNTPGISCLIRDHAKLNEVKQQSFLTFSGFRKGTEGLTPVCFLVSEASPAGPGESTPQACLCSCLAPGVGWATYPETRPSTHLPEPKVALGFSRHGSWVPGRNVWRGSFP